MEYGDVLVDRQGMRWEHKQATGAGTCEHDATAISIDDDVCEKLEGQTAGVMCIPANFTPYSNALDPTQSDY